MKEVTYSYWKPLEENLLLKKLEEDNYVEYYKIDNKSKEKNILVLKTERLNKYETEKSRNTYTYEEILSNTQDFPEEVINYIERNQDK